MFPPNRINSASRKRRVQPFLPHKFRTVFPFKPRPDKTFPEFSVSRKIEIHRDIFPGNVRSDPFQFGEQFKIVDADVKGSRDIPSTNGK